MYKTAARFFRDSRERTGQDRELGKEHEIDLFGVPFKGQDLRRFRDYVEKHGTKDGYLQYGQAFDAIRKLYPEDREVNPEKEFLTDLKLEIAEMIGASEASMDEIKIYSALGTPLDHFHGIDAWIEVPNSVGHPVVVTLDASKNSVKQQGGYKANIIVGDVPAPEEDDYLDVIEDYASQVVHLLSRRMHDFSHLQDHKLEIKDRAAA